VAGVHRHVETRGIGQLHFHDAVLRCAGYDDGLTLPGVQLLQIRTNVLGERPEYGAGESAAHQDSDGTKSERHFRPVY